MEITIADRVAASREHSRLLKELRKETHPGIRRELKQKIHFISGFIGLPTPNLDDIGIAREPIEADPIVEIFWTAANTLGLNALNHSRQHDRIAINVNEFFALAKQSGLVLPNKPLIMRALPTSTNPRFVEANKAMRSPITGKTLRCYVFEQS